MKNPITPWLEAHPKIKQAVTLGKLGKSLRAKAASVLAWMALHTGIVVPGILLVVAGASIPAAYSLGVDAGHRRCVIERVQP